MRGGVIQDHLSAPCSATFPKCDEYYFSSDAYKYPDCYTLVSKSRIISKSLTSENDTFITADESSHIKQWQISTIVTFIIILIIPISTTLFLLLSKDMDRDVRTSNRSMDQHFATCKSESSANNKASSQSSTQCFAKSDSSAYRRNKYIKCNIKMPDWQGEETTELEWPRRCIFVSVECIAHFLNDSYTLLPNNHFFLLGVIFDGFIMCFFSSKTLSNLILT